MLPMKSQSGQAAVETAIVMPLFVFLILGLLQIQLLNQARLMTKYAAYKAVRVGAIHSAKKSAMRNEALAVLLPFTGRRTSDSFFSATRANYLVSMTKARLENAAGSLVDVTVCEPYGNAPRGDFDDPSGEMGIKPSKSADPTWKQANRGRLAIQVTQYHQMVIPFANQLIWHIVSGAENANTMRVMRMNAHANPVVFNGARGTTGWARGLGVYVMPIRASWAMRMHSNFLDGQEFKIPGKNDCIIAWAKKP
jgi:TadE-like protein